MKQYSDNKETNRRESIFYGSFKNQLPQIFSGEIRLLSITAFIPHINKKYSADFLALELTCECAHGVRDLCWPRKREGGGLGALVPLVPRADHRLPSRPVTGFYSRKR